jgi:hypothetical protein
VGADTDLRITDVGRTRVTVVAGRAEVELIARAPECCTGTGATGVAAATVGSKNCRKTY